MKSIWEIRTGEVKDCDFWQGTPAGKPKNTCKPRWSISKGWSWYQAKNLDVEWGLVCCGLVDWTRIIPSWILEGFYIQQKIPPKKKLQGSISWLSSSDLVVATDLVTKTKYKLKHERHHGTWLGLTFTNFTSLRSSVATCASDTESLASCTVCT